MLSTVYMTIERELDDTYAAAAVIRWSGTYDYKTADIYMSQYDYLAEIERRARRYLCCRSSY